MIVESRYVQEPPNKDGRFLVTEQYTLDTGDSMTCSYLCDNSMDPSAILAARIIQINQQVEAEEVNAAALLVAKTAVESTLKAAITKGELSEEAAKLAGYLNEPSKLEIAVGEKLNG